jgi:polar amino acid transport system permease protein
MIMAGLELTIQLALVSLVGSLCWSLILLPALTSKLRVLKMTVRAYIELWRNTPLLLQLYLLYFGLPYIGIYWSSFWCGVLAITLQHGAFLADIFRTGVESVGHQQREAARAIALSRFQQDVYVIWPQGLAKVLGPTGSQMVLLIKDTSLLSAIGVLELTLIGKQLTEQSARTFEVFFVIGLLFLLLTSAAAAVARLLEHRYLLRF